MKRTYDTNILEEVSLTVAVMKANKEQNREVDDPDNLPWTNDSYWQTIMNKNVLASYGNTGRDDILQLCVSRWSSLTDQQRLTVCTDLGVPELSAAPIETQLKILSKYGIDAFLELSPEKQLETFGILIGT